MSSFTLQIAEVMINMSFVISRNDDLKREGCLPTGHGSEKYHQSHATCTIIYTVLWELEADLK